MKRGPRAGAGRNGDPRTFIEKAEQAWNGAPDWIGELAAEADRHGLKGAATTIGMSPSLVSTVLANKYAGDVAGVEERVRGALMGLTVECPVLGTIGRDRCLSEQKEPFRATSAHRAQLYVACRGGCPHSKITGDENG